MRELSSRDSLSAWTRTSEKSASNACSIDCCIGAGMPAPPDALWIRRSVSASTTPPAAPTVAAARRILGADEITAPGRAEAVAERCTLRPIPPRTPDAPGSSTAPGLAGAGNCAESARTIWSATRSAATSAGSFAAPTTARRCTSNVEVFDAAGNLSTERERCSSLRCSRVSRSGNTTASLSNIKGT